MLVPQYITSQEQARCLFHNTSPLKNRQDACSTIHQIACGVSRPSNFY
ncbi:hypothetical protein [Microcoleus sp. B13-B6]